MDGTAATVRQTSVWVPTPHIFPSPVTPEPVSTRMLFGTPDKGPCQIASYFLRRF